MAGSGVADGDHHMRLSSRTLDQIDSPIGTAYALADRRHGAHDLLDLGQAAPQYPPAMAVTEEILAGGRDPHGADYTDIAGLPVLREAFAADLRTGYCGDVTAADIVITAGCNQAFCVATSAVAQPGDEIVLALPYYFNHDMWLRLNGMVPVYLEPGPDLVPCPDAAANLITPRTRAIALVSPGNPTGVTVDADRLAGFAELADRRGVALILDETYRSFRDTDEPPHTLLSEPGWRRTVISLHSFSKELALPGYRVGAVVASPEVNRQIVKILDCVAICAPRISQRAAWAGLTHAQQWRLARSREVAERRGWFESEMARRPGGFDLISAGGFFGWIRHPFTDRPTAAVVTELAVKHDLLVIPGTAFLPDDRRMLRVSFSNAGQAELADFAGRLGALARSAG